VSGEHRQRVASITPPPAPEVAAAIVAALERFSSDTEVGAPATELPHTGVGWPALVGHAESLGDAAHGGSNGWQRAALLEAVGGPVSRWDREDAWRIGPAQP